MPDSLQNIANLAPFDGELMFVIDVLVAAASAPTKVGAFRNHAMRRGLSNLDHFRVGKFLFLADDLRRYRFPINCEWDENDLPILPRHAFATKSDVYDF